MYRANLPRNEQCCVTISVQTFFLENFLNLLFLRKYLLIINKCHNYGLKTPEFHQEEDFRVVIWRTKESINESGTYQSVPERTRAYQDVPEKKTELLSLIKENPAISRAKLAQKLHISERQVRNITDSLKEEGILVRNGGDSGKWIIK